MQPVFPLAWAEDLPAIQQALEQELAEVTRREEDTQSLGDSLEEVQGALFEQLEGLRERIAGFEKVVSGTTAGLQEVDEVLATEEETWRQQLAAMEEFRRRLSEWVDHFEE